MTLKSTQYKKFVLMFFLFNVKYILDYYLQDILYLKIQYN